jgi:ADP-glucose pyrophosphorylase
VYAGAVIALVTIMLALSYALGQRHQGGATGKSYEPGILSILMSGPAALLASMGIYVFTFEVLRQVVQEDTRQASTCDFGRDILPGPLGRYRAVAFPFGEYCLSNHIERENF